MKTRDQDHKSSRCSQYFATLILDHFALILNYNKLGGINYYFFLQVLLSLQMYKVHEKKLNELNKQVLLGCNVVFIIAF